MSRFYRALVTKWPVGTAIEYREPSLQGLIVTKITDSTTGGDLRLIIMDCTESEHAANLRLPGVEELQETEAAQVAAEFQPKRTVTRFDPRARKEEQVTIEALDLASLLARQK